MRAYRMRTAGLYDPVGIGLKHPELSWNLEGEGVFQSAYQIQAAHSAQGFAEGELVWDTGKVKSSSMTGIFYRQELSSREQVFWRVRVWNEKDEPGEWSPAARFEMGLTNASDWEAFWISGDYLPQKGLRYPADHFRKTFSLIRKPAKARLYITACGIYETFLNGRRVGRQVLTPGSTCCDKRLNVQTYDVTPLLTEGQNVWTISLGDGWFRGKCGAFGASGVFGDTTCVIAQLEIIYPEGEREIIVTDNAFSWSNDGPVRFNDMKDGETVDFSFTPPYSEKAKTVIWHAALTCSDSVPVTEHERFTPEVLHTPDGSTVLDFGQNIAGYIALSVQGEAGRTASLQLGEILDEQGNFTLKNLITEETSPYIPDYCDDSRLQTIELVMDGKRHEYKPSFSVQGFRYAKLRDWPEAVNPANFTAIAVYSDLEVLSDFQCSNPLIKKLVDNTLWSMKGNFLDVPTDCPTRERSAWLGDAQLFFDTGCCFMDLSAFFRKWLRDIYDDQAEDGKLYNIVPKCAAHEGMNAYVEGSSGWTDAGILLPYRHYLHYGDRRILEENYTGMKRLAGFLLSRMGAPLPPDQEKDLPAGEYRKYVVTAGFHFGEWNEPDSSPVDVMKPKYETATAYLAYSLSCLARIAGWLGKAEDQKEYDELSLKVKSAYRYYFAPEGAVDSERMCELVRPVALGLLDGEAKEKTTDRLAELVVRRKYHIGTGFLSTPFVLWVLSEGGYDDLAYRLLENEEYPSWLYEVKQGATTVWENWDGIASHNHYSNGAVCSWIFGRACGIQVTGENEFLIAPVPGGNSDCMDHTFRSDYGPVRCRWERTGGGINYHIEIPVGTKARAVLTGRGPMELSAGSYDISAAGSNIKKSTR